MENEELIILTDGQIKSLWDRVVGGDHFGYFKMPWQGRSLTMRTGPGLKMESVQDSHTRGMNLGEMVVLAQMIDVREKKSEMGKWLKGEIVEQLAKRRKSLEEELGKVKDVESFFAK